jgi:uncharacterized protein (TIGR00369 family)
LADFPEEQFIGFNKDIGFRFVNWTPTEAAVALDLEPRHLNRSGVVHGGILAALLDAAGGFTGVYPVEGKLRRCVTVAMTTNYLGQTKQGTITCTARLTGGGRTIFVATAEVHAEDGTLLAIGQGTYRYIAQTPR